MANTVFKLRRSSVAGKVPNTSTLSIGELGLNLTDKILYSSDGSSVFEVGSNVTSAHVTNSLTLDNDRQLRFKTVNSAAYSYFVQQSDDNFVLYTTNASYSPRPIWSVFANSSTSYFGIGAPVNFSGANVNLSSTTLYSNGSSGSAGQYLTSNGTATYWSTPGVASVNTNAQWTWNNTHTFNSNVSFSDDIGIASNNAIYFGGLVDANWRMARNSNTLTKWIYTNNTIDIVTANSPGEGFTIGLVSNATYFETGYLGTYVANKLVVGSASSNSTINSTAFTGTANNTSFVGSVSAANVVSNAQLSANLSNYQTTAGLAANVATLTSNNSTYAYDKTEGNLNVNSAVYSTNAINANNSSYLGGTAASGYQTTAGLAGNVATLAANSATYLGGSGNFGNASGIYTSGTINAASHTVGTSTIANTTGVYSGIVNATTISTGSVNVINASGLTTTANVNVGAAGELIVTAGAGLWANGGVGTAGQVLTSNASSIYWSTISGGATLTANSTDTVTYYLPMANTSSGTWSNGVVSTTKLYFVPSTGTLSATIFNSLSDVNTKTHIEKINNALNTVKNIDGVSFNWKDTGAKSYGVIAQEIEKILPDIVNENKGVKSVNYDALIGFLIEAIKELSEKVDKLENGK